MNPAHGGRAPQPKAILFDFDGTLADSYAAITATVNYVRAAHGFPPLAEAEVRREVGRGVDHLLRHTLPNSDPVRDVALYRQHHPTVLRSGTHLLPGVLEVLGALKHAGLRLAVCSNKPIQYTRQLLAYLKLSSNFDAVLGPEDVARPKPAPDMLQAALARVGIAASDALYVGDMAIDVETARAADVTVWVVATGSDARPILERARPDQLLARLADMLPLLGIG